MTIHMKNLERLSLAEMEEFVRGSRQVTLSLEGAATKNMSLDKISH
jgi:hypothetical protein